MDGVLQKSKICSEMNYHYEGTGIKPRTSGSCHELELEQYCHVTGTSGFKFPKVE